MGARRLLAGLLTLAAVIPGWLRAETNAAKATPVTERYLLIVETSKPMQRRENATLGIVRDILMSGLNGQFHDDGTLGVWTFNEGLSAGRFPLQTWSSAERGDITQRTLAFLKAQKYAKQASFDKVAPSLRAVITDSRRLTVILISSGDSKISGTPFDDRINESFQRWREQQQKEHMPFVTVLRARKGQVASFAVNTPPWPLQVPHLAEEPKPIPTVHAEPPKPRPPPATKTVPPLIISGRKPRPEPAPAPKPEPTLAETAVPHPVVVAAATNQPATVKAPEPAAPPAEVAKAQSAPAVPEKPAPELLAKATPAPIPASKPKPEPPKAPEPKAAEPAPTNPTAALPSAALVPKPAPEPLKASEPKAAEPARAKPAAAPLAASPMPALEPEPLKASETKAAEPAPAKPTPAPPAVAPVPKPVPTAVEQPKHIAAPEVKPEPAPAPAATPEPALAAPPNAVPAQATATNLASTAPEPPLRPAPSVAAATVAPAGSLLSTRTILIAAGGLAVVAVGLALVLMRRARPAPQGSLITRSFERGKGP